METIKFVVGHHIFSPLCQMTAVRSKEKAINQECVMVTNKSLQVGSQNLTRHY